MNGKAIVLFTLCLNIVMLYIIFACNVGGATCGESLNGGILTTLFSIDLDQDLSQSQQMNLASDAQSAVDRARTERGAGVSFTGGVSIFLDLGAMALGILLLFTPIPLLDLSLSFGWPLYFSLAIVPILSMLLIIAVAEFLRGGEF